MPRQIINIVFTFIAFMFCSFLCVTCSRLNINQCSLFFTYFKYFSRILLFKICLSYLLISLYFSIFPFALPSLSLIGFSNLHHICITHVVTRVYWNKKTAKRVLPNFIAQSALSKFTIAQQCLQNAAIQDITKN